MSVHVIVGAQWGDEGKGKIVDLLSADADIVARYQGGANAGHTIEIGEQRFVLHLIPSGIFHPHVVCVIGNGVVIDPVALLDEIRLIEALGVSLAGRLKISHHAHLIMPYHKLIDQLAERGAHPIGTTGRGIGPAYNDKAARIGIRIVDLQDSASLTAMLRHNLEEKNAVLRKLYGAEELDVDAIIREYLHFDELIDPYIADTPLFLNTAIREGRHILCEGAQGALLDLDHGTYPFVTSSSPVSGGATTGLGIPPTAINAVIGVMKAYTTRVGNGPFPTELNDETGERIRARGAEYGATTGRPRRCGWFDAVALRYSAMINGFASASITKLDVLRGLDEIKVCTGYERNGTPLRGFPPDAHALETVTPVYQSFPGWTEDICAARTLDELPANARAYVAALGELIGVRIHSVSVGPARAQTILAETVPW